MTSVNEAKEMERLMEERVFVWEWESAHEWNRARKTKAELEMEGGSEEDTRRKPGMVQLSCSDNGRKDERVEEACEKTNDGFHTLVMFLSLDNLSVMVWKRSNGSSEPRRPLWAEHIPIVWQSFFFFEETRPWEAVKTF